MWEDLIKEEKAFFFGSRETLDQILRCAVSLRLQLKRTRDFDSLIGVLGTLSYPNLMIPPCTEFEDPIFPVHA